MGRKTRSIAKPDAVIVLDPSGSFKEGKGTTGIITMQLYEDGMYLKPACLYAKDFKTQTAYWNAHLKFIAEYMRTNGLKNVHLVVEDYLLYGDKAVSQTNSRMETSQLIGVIKNYAYERNIPIIMQTAAQVKRRWTNDILAHKGYLKPVGKRWSLPGNHMLNRHQLDALRHGIHYYTFKGWTKCTTD